MEEPVYVLEVLIQAKAEDSLDSLIRVVVDLCQVDPHLAFRVVGTGAEGLVLKGTSEQPLDIAIDRITREFGIPLTIGAPEVAYRETITHTVEHDYTHKKQTGGSGQFARVKIRFEPGAPGSGFAFENEVAGGAVPKAYVPGVEKGLNAAKETGVIAGFPVIDVKASLIDGAYHDVDSNLLTFEIAAKACLQEGIAKAGPRLLEPIMRVEVVTPEEHMGDVIGDLSSRHGQVTGMDQRANMRLINALVPLANLLGYVNTLRAMTRGLGTYATAFDHYEPIPPSDPYPPAHPGAAIGLR
jgi:elongation factor G